MLARLELTDVDVELIKSLLGKQCATHLGRAAKIATGRYGYGHNGPISADGIEVCIADAMRYVDIMKRLGSNY